MKPVNQSDFEALKEITERENLIRSLVRLASEAEQLGDFYEAESLLHRAQHLSIYVGEGLRIRILNEESDFKSWRAINHAIETLVKPLAIERQTAK